MDDARTGRDDAQVTERRLCPAQELVALAVALVLALDVEGEGGTPVKSWRMTRDGMNGTSASAGTPGRQAANVSTSASVTIPPPAWRRTFSSRTRTVTGRPVEAVRSPRASRR